nr:mucin-1-like [Aegilops tauschii subsp. strangulata]
MAASPLSLSMTGCSPPASPDCATNSGSGGAEFRGVTDTADWRRAASSACFFAASVASASASFFRAAASAFSASAFSRRAASYSSRTSRVFHSVASRRSAAGLIRRVVVEVSADPMMEAAADFSRESGALDQGKQSKETQTRSARKEKGPSNAAAGPSARLPRASPERPLRRPFAGPRPAGASPPPGVLRLLLPPARPEPPRPPPVAARLRRRPASRPSPRPAPSPRRPAFPAGGSPPSPASKLAGAASSPGRVGVDEIHPSPDPNAPMSAPDLIVPGSHRPVSEGIFSSKSPKSLYSGALFNVP